ncbi:OmpA family protein [bacterium]|nr:OmpA family protein [bacterium]
MPPVFCSEVDLLEGLFKNNMPKSAIYTKVPRGLIISFDEKIFFDTCDSGIKQSSLAVLDVFAELLKAISNYCVIEHHIQNNLCTENLQNWEISAIRSSNIAEYLVKYKNVPSEKIFDIGFGETMPFKENVNPQNSGFDNRVDFVIIEYEAKR